MNQTIDLNNTELIREIFLRTVGSSWLYDSLYLFLIVPMGLIGVILNILSISIFSRKEFIRVNIFKYFRIYSFVSLILSSTLSFAFLITPRYFFTLSISYSARIYKCSILPSYILPLFLLFSNLMSILVNLERASNFNNKLKKFKQTSPYLTSTILFLICVVINTPTYFLSTPATDQEVYDALLSYQNVIKFKGICLKNQISLTFWGKIFSLFGYATKDLLTLCLDIASNILSAYYLRVYFIRKRDLTTRNNQKKITENEIKSEKIQLNNTFMTIYLTLFSIVVQLIIFASDMIIYFNPSSPNLLFAFIFIIFFVVTFKQIINFAFFYTFNLKFRKFFMKTVNFSTVLNSKSY